MDLLDMLKILAMALVAVLVFAGMGAVVLYTNEQNADKEREGLAVRAQMQMELSMIQHKVWGELSSVSENLTDASLKLRDIGLGGTGARAVLSELMANVEYAVDVVTIDVEGRIVTAEPSMYHEVE
ncbi:MAG TPA: hypothetical protein VLH13_01350, partial [Methanomassiliicoccales archaeon]|nr:hypothetical protein [Methanomassiliicoccales archaeon]